MNSIDTIFSDAQPNAQLTILSDFCSNSAIVLYGAGLTGKHILHKLKGLHIKPKFIIDDTPSKQGMMLEDISIISFDEFLKIQEPYALVVTMLNPALDFNSFKKQLREKGVQNIFSFLELSYLFPNELLPYYHFDVQEKLFNNADELNKAFDLFSEEESRNIFLGNLDFRINLDFEKLPLGDKQEYFPNTITTISDDSIFFDCGAYDGDTLKSFVEKNPGFKSAYAFEPDTNNFNKILNYCSHIDKTISKKVFVFNYGISSSHGFLRFNSLDNMSSAIAADGNSIIQTMSLDESFLPLLKNYNGKIFIKMDIEGEEPNALIGCRDLIKEKSPNLAISIYHNADDLHKIPLYIASINSSYNFYLRQHGNDSMDLVLYAISD